MDFAQPLTTFVVASRNQGKILEIEALLQGIPVRLLSLSAFSDAPEVVEDKDSLEGNAVKKAQVISQFTGFPAIADDTGLEVVALSGGPGVMSARYAGPDCDDAKNRKLLLNQLYHVEDRSARFRTVAALVDGTGIHTFEGICVGQITRKERGDLGFGYDPLFLPDGENRTFAELPMDEKNAISHRGKALRKLAAFLKDRFEKES